MIEWGSFLFKAIPTYLKLQLPRKALADATKAVREEQMGLSKADCSFSVPSSALYKKFVRLDRPVEDMTYLKMGTLVLKTL